MGRLLATAILLSGFLVSAQPAWAMSCRPWMRLEAADKEATVHDMIDDAVEGNAGRNWNINRSGVARCLHAQAPQIANEFDDVCSDSRTADMQAIQRVFKSYVWSCAG